MGNKEIQRLCMIKDGWLIIDKPQGLTSHDVVSKARHILRIKHIGHTGTLDPMATGVIVLAVGKATRLIQFLPSDKSYIADVHLGISTDTMDTEGKVISTSDKVISREDLLEIIPQFKGKIKQQPPVFSALHYEGRRMYELAREGVTIENIPFRDVEIYNIELLEFQFPVFKIKVDCSSGTYIRSLASDMGQILDCGAHLCSLRRIMANDFPIESSIKIEDLNSETAFFPFELPLQALRRLTLNAEYEKRFKYGHRLPVEELSDYVEGEQGIFCVYNDSNDFIGIGEIIEDVLHPVRVIH